MLNHKKEGIPIHGKLYPEYQTILARYMEKGAELINQEIAELWQQIMIRTDILAEYEPQKRKGKKS
jgi:hypothetical protein